MTTERANVSPDGKWVVYRLNPRPWKISINGGEPVPLLDKQADGATISPDGKLIACLYKEQENMLWKVAIITFDGGRLLKILDIPVLSGQHTFLRWTADSGSLVYIDIKDGVSNLWLQTLSAGRPRQLTDFKSESINSFDLSRDGRLAISRGTTTSDVVLISDLK